MKLKRALLAIIFVSMGYVASATAGSMRCGVHIVQDGQRDGPGKYEVLKKCGDPVERYGNTWVYELKGSRYIVTFKDNGMLERIRR